MVSFQWQGSCWFFSWWLWHRGFKPHNCHRRRSCGRCSCYCHPHLHYSVPVQVRLFPALLHSAKTPLLAPVNLKTLISHICARLERRHSIGDLFWWMWGENYLFLNLFIRNDHRPFILHRAYVSLTIKPAFPKPSSIHAHSMVCSLTINKNKN